MIRATPDSTRCADPVATAAVAALAATGSGLLAARPALLAIAAHPAGTLAVLFGALLAAGLVAPLPAERARVSAGTTRRALLIGALAIVAARLIVGGLSPASLTLPVLLANSLAAVAEEVWFRRVCYGLLAPAGPAAAIAGSALLFAAVHVAIYGLWVVPVDLAAGALFGWQRAVTGSWTASAATHVLANVLALL